MNTGSSTKELTLKLSNARLMKVEKKIKKLSDLTGLDLHINSWLTGLSRVVKFDGTKLVTTGVDVVRCVVQMSNNQPPVVCFSLINSSLNMLACSTSSVSSTPYSVFRLL